MRCAIIGAGLAGLACADALRSAGHEALLFDKGRGPGGRMSTRRWETRFGKVELDHGAPFFHATDSRFRAQVASWERAGLVARWPAADDAWVGIPRMSAVISALAADHEVAWDTFVRGVIRAPGGAWRLSSEQGLHGPFDAVVVAIPAEQAVPILALQDFGMARAAAQAVSRPCWTGLFAFAQELPTSATRIENEGAIALALANRAKPGRGGPEAWIVHACAEWSAENLERASAEVAPLLLAALGRALGIASLPQSEATAHRWRYASSDGIGQPALWNPVLLIGACGDWLMGPRAEYAWLSGNELGRRIAAHAGAAAPRAPRARAVRSRAGHAVG